MSEDVVRVAPTDARRPARAASTELLVLPPLIVDAGPVAVARFLEFFAARIANRRTRPAYGRAVGQFLAWCEARTPVAPLPASSPTRPLGINGRTSAPPDSSLPEVCSFQLPKVCSFRLPLTRVCGHTKNSPNRLRTLGASTG